MCLLAWSYPSCLAAGLPLKMMIDAYLKQKAAALNDAAQLEKDRKRLTQALVRFAEKLLFMANHTELLSGNRSVATTASTQIEQYAQILQSIGNTILVQADERHFLDEFENRERKASLWRLEVEAWHHQYAQRAQDVLSRLIHHIGRECEALQAQLKRLAAREKELQGESEETRAKKEQLKNQQKAILKKIDELQIVGQRLTGYVASDWMMAHDAKEPVDANVFLVALAGKVGVDAAAAKKDKDHATASELVTTQKAMLARQMLPLSFALPVIGDDSPESDPRKVLDQLIAHLEHAHIREITEHGTQSLYAARLRQAIEVATRAAGQDDSYSPGQRVFKSSLAATSLQSDPGIGWRNMLGSQALKGLPLVGQPIVNTGANTRIRKKIDKQFWQNINRIRVSGAGNTNYVIVTQLSLEATLSAVAVEKFKDVASNGNAAQMLPPVPAVKAQESQDERQVRLDAEQKMGARIIDALRRIKHFCSALNTRISGLPAAAFGAAGDRQNAIRTARAVIQQELRTAVDQRKDVVERFESPLMIVSETLQ